MKYSAVQPVVCMQASSAAVHSFFPAKQSIFNISINLHAICASHIVQQIEVILLDPGDEIFHSIRLHRYYKFCFSITSLTMLSLATIAPDHLTMPWLVRIAPDQPPHYFSMCCCAVSLTFLHELIVQVEFRKKNKEAYPPLAANITATQPT